MANVGLLVVITASGMYIFDYCTKLFFGITHYSSFGFNLSGLQAQ